MNAASGFKMIAARTAVILGILVATSVGAYALTRKLEPKRIAAQSSRVTRPPNVDSLRSLYPSGTYLIVYVLMASDCGYSTEKRTMEAIRSIRGSMIAKHGREFADVFVVGVSIGDDLDSEIKHIQKLRKANKAFDQVSVGGSWLNEFVTRLVWREGVATPNLPQVIVVTRDLDSRAYPRTMAVGDQDSLVLRVMGRPDLIRWVKAGTPLMFGSSVARK